MDERQLPNLKTRCDYVFDSNDEAIARCKLLPAGRQTQFLEQILGQFI